MRIVLLLSMLVLTSNSAFSQDSGQISNDTNRLNPENGLHYNAFLGFSPYGGFGIEVSKIKHSVGIGFPYRLFYRYYKTPDNDSWFFGVYAGRYELDIDNEKIIDGVAYTDKVTSDAGFGIGYIWQWSSGWNVAASFSVHYMDEKYTNPEQEKNNDRSTNLFPGINVGYRF